MECMVGLLYANNKLCICNRISNYGGYLECRVSQMVMLLQ